MGTVYQFPAYDKRRAKEFAARKNRHSRKYQWAYHKFYGSYIVAKFPKGSHGRAVLRRMTA